MLRTEESLNKFAKYVVKQSRSNLTRQGKRAGNSLYDSIGYNLMISKNSFSLEFEMEEYGDFVDRGVSGTKNKISGAAGQFKYDKPSKKHVDELVKWVNRKRLRLRGEDGKFKTGGQRSLAYAIGYSIKRKGIKPSLFFTKPFEQAFKNLPKELEEAYALDVEDFINFTFRNNGTNT